MLTARCTTSRYKAKMNQSVIWLYHLTLFHTCLSATVLFVMPLLVSKINFLKKTSDNLLIYQSTLFSSLHTHTSSSSPSSPLLPPITPFLFHSKHRTYLSTNPSYHTVSLTFRTDFIDFLIISDLISSSFFVFSSFSAFYFDFRLHWLFNCTWNLYIFLLFRATLTKKRR